MVDTKIVMACGHVSTARYTAEDGEKSPVCPSCMQTNPKGARETISLKNRVARCRSCGKPAASDTTLFGFEYNLKGDVDTYYDGCMGW
jgi:hypothetical protein